jgi:hypothetical protein
VGAASAADGFSPETKLRSTPVGAIELLQLGVESYIASLSDNEFERLVAITRPHDTAPQAQAVI